MAGEQVESGLFRLIVTLIVTYRVRMAGERLSKNTPLFPLPYLNLVDEAPVCTPH